MFAKFAETNTFVIVVGRSSLRSSTLVQVYPLCTSFAFVVVITCMSGVGVGIAVLFFVSKSRALLLHISSMCKVLKAFYSLFRNRGH